MRRAIARGRLFPQSYSTDRRYGRLCLKAVALFPLMWANADDQGRLPGDPDEIKYAVCPNIDHITKGDIPDLLKNLEQNDLIKHYDTPKSPAIQLLDWWEVQRLQWAWPSEYPPPEGWQDRLRYKKSAKEVVTINWGSPESSPENTPERSPENSPENSSCSPLTTPSEKEEEKEEEEERGRGRGISPENSPESSGEEPSPSPTADTQIILRFLIKSFKHEWGRVPANAPDTVIEREPNGRELAQLRDLGKELSARGGVPLDYIKQAFGEAAGAKKFHISYVRAVLLDWLGLARSPP